LYTGDETAREVYDVVSISGTFLLFAQRETVRAGGRGGGGGEEAGGPLSN
jgi:hypothetical protein